MDQDIPDYLREKFPYSVTTRDHYNRVGDGELWAWLSERNCVRRVRNDGDYEFLEVNRFLFRDEMIAIEFKMRFG